MNHDTDEDADVLAELREDEQMAGPLCDDWTFIERLQRRLALARREAREARADLVRLDEIRSHGCECGAEDACRFARERDEARRERDICLSECEAVGHILDDAKVDGDDGLQERVDILRTQRDELREALSGRTQQDAAAVERGRIANVLEADAQVIDSARAVTYRQLISWLRAGARGQS